MAIKLGMLVAVPHISSGYMLGMIADLQIINGLEFYAIDWYDPNDKPMRLEGYGPKEIKQYLRDYKRYRSQIDGRTNKV